MTRRELIRVASGALIAWPFALRAQQSSKLLIGYLDGSGLNRWFDAFQDGLADLGYVHGKTVIVERRSAGGQAARLAQLAAELLQLQPNVIVASTTAATFAARNITTTIPIVFAYATDPVGLGIVASLARPGGNITGQTNQAPGLGGKRLELLHEIRPGPRLGVVWTPSFAANHADFREIQSAAAALGVSLVSFEVTQPDDIEAAFKGAAETVTGAAVLSGPLIFAQRDRVVKAAAKHSVPAIYYDAEYAESGGLIAYGPDLAALHHSAATFVDKILKGMKPEDIPIEQPTRFKLVVNVKVAKELGLTIPSTLLVRADEVIE
jgi:putative ABC transport system substrate-binding protein